MFYLSAPNSPEETTMQDLAIIDHLESLEDASQAAYLRTMTDQWLANQPVEVRNYLLDQWTALLLAEDEAEVDVDDYADDDHRAEDAYARNVYEPF